MNDRTILHCDCNGFYASCEQIRHPELKRVPMAVCGDPESRHGIILAKNELAKGFGVKTAETIREAKAKCPDLVLVPPHHEDYARWSKVVNAIYQRYTEQVEPFGIDESWLDGEPDAFRRRKDHCRPPAPGGAGGNGTDNLGGGVLQQDFCQAGFRSQKA